MAATVAREMPIRISATEDTALAAEAAIRNLKRVRQEAERPAKPGKGGVIGDLQGAFGRGSSFKESMELIRGGGAVAGLSLLGNALSDASAKAVELSDQFAKGKITVSTLFEEMAQGIPIFGSFWKFGRDLRELATHEERTARETAEHYQKIADANVQWTKNVLIRQAFEKQGGTFTRSLAMELELLGKTGFDLERTKAEHRQELDFKRVDENLEAAKKAVKGDNAAFVHMQLEVAAQAQRNAIQEFWSDTVDEINDAEVTAQIATEERMKARRRTELIAIERQANEERQARDRQRIDGMVDAVTQINRVAGELDTPTRRTSRFASFTDDRGATGGNALRRDSALADQGAQKERNDDRRTQQVVNAIVKANTDLLRAIGALPTQQPVVYWK